jgi:hypothetical protein
MYFEIAIKIIKTIRQLLSVTILLKFSILQRVQVMCVAEKLSSFPSKISPRVMFNITGHLKGCTE